jgi:hypothetical protein
MSEQKPQVESEGGIGQSASTGGLARCPCGAIPEALGIMDTGQGRKYMACMGTCCGEWMIEFRSDYHQQDSAECMERAIDAWNRAPRMANEKVRGPEAASPPEAPSRLTGSKAI